MRQGQYPPVRSSPSRIIFTISLSSFSRTATGSLPFRIYYNQKSREGQDPPLRVIFISCGRTCSQCIDPWWGYTHGYLPRFCPESSSSLHCNGVRTEKRYTRCSCLRDCSYYFPPLMWDMVSMRKIRYFIQFSIDMLRAYMYNVCGKCRSSDTIKHKTNNVLEERKELP